jgi:ligand-binding sensor domain-containing protein/two-component sensor histidine kinase
MSRTRNPVLLFLICGILCCSPRIRAQNLVAKHYTVESGIELPSNEVYGIQLDRNNMIWATTDRGVWSYDGYRGKQYTVSDGLRDNANLKMFRDNQDRIWLSTINNYLDYIAGGKVYNYPPGQAIHDFPAGSALIQQISGMQDNSILVAFNGYGLFRFRTGEKPDSVLAQRRNHEKATIAIHYHPDDYCWDLITPPEPENSRESRVESENGWVYITCGATINNSFRKSLCPIGEREFLFSLFNRVFHIRDGRLVGEVSLPDQVIDVFVDHEGNFWVGMDGRGGVLEYPGGDLSKKPSNYLRKESVSGIAQDHEGNYWFATTDNGIFFINTLKVVTLDPPGTDSGDNIITALASDGENLYMGTQSGLLLKVEESSDRFYTLKRITRFPANGAIRKLYFTPVHHLAVLNNRFNEIDTDGHPVGIGTINSFPFDMTCRPGNEYLLSMTGRIKIIRDGRVIREWNQETIPKAYPGDTILTHAISRVRSLYLDPDSTLWLGSQTSGLFSYNNGSICSWARKDRLFSHRIHCIVRSGKNIWASLSGFGIAVIRPDSSYFRITQKDGLSSDIIDVLFSENDSIVWAGTNNGLNRITLRNGAPTISYYTIREGLPSNRIFRIIKHKGDLWVATTQGAIRLDPDLTRPPVIKPRVILEPQLVNGKTRILMDSTHLKPSECNLVFRFMAVNYRKPSQIQYHYKLEGADRDFITTTNLESRYTELRYGKYTFRVNASYNGDFSPDTERVLTFWIQKHWYQTALAWGLFIVLLTAAVMLAFLRILKSTKTRELQKRRLLMAEKNSLLAQMNPHFIFNSLNSIQHFIIQNDEAQANNYLSSFSGLIRRILENSRKNLITLAEEISTLTLYLSMEKLRFEGDFEFRIIRDSGIDYNETMIPPMMIQPLVENAIWHGIMPLKSNGLLKITFKSEGDYYTCQVEDNGIGRERAAQMKRKRRLHIATGIRNIEERIELLNKLNKRQMKLTITDLQDEKGEARGTRVELVMPFEIKI